MGLSPTRPQQLAGTRIDPPVSEPSAANTAPAASIFPRITNGNLNAPSLMTGEKAADHILGRAPLAAENAGPWINPRWEVSDR